MKQIIIESDISVRYLLPVWIGEK